MQQRPDHEMIPLIVCWVSIHRSPSGGEISGPLRYL
jgi:hypothetical protein